jgi:hypothetical protein
LPEHFRSREPRENHMNKLHRDPFRSAHVLVQRKLFADLSLLLEGRD